MARTRQNHRVAIRLGDSAASPPRSSLCSTVRRPNCGPRTRAKRVKSLPHRRRRRRLWSLQGRRMTRGRARCGRRRRSRRPGTSGTSLLVRLSESESLVSLVVALCSMHSRLLALFVACYLFSVRNLNDHRPLLQSACSILVP